MAWKDVEQRIQAASEKVIVKKPVPILFFMELRVMDIPIVAAYTGFWKWQVKRHLKYAVFRKTFCGKLAKYAELFEVSRGRIKNNEST